MSAYLGISGGLQGLEGQRSYYPYLLILLKGWISPVVMSSATLQTRCNPVFYALS